MDIKTTRGGIVSLDTLITVKDSNIQVEGFRKSRNDGKYSMATTLCKDMSIRLYTFANI